MDMAGLGLFEKFKNSKVSIWSTESLPSQFLEPSHIPSGLRDESFHSCLQQPETPWEVDLFSLKQENWRGKVYWIGAHASGWELVGHSWEQGIPFSAISFRQVCLRVYVVAEPGLR